MNPEKWKIRKQIHKDDEVDKKSIHFRYVDFKQSLDQIHVAKLINNDIDKNGFFLSESMENIVIENKFSFSTTINTKIQGVTKL